MMEKTLQAYRREDKLRTLIADNSQLLMALSRFGIPLGFGDKSVEEVCSSRDIDTPTFLAVANYIGGRPVDRNGVHPGELMKYLMRAHDHFLDFELPMIRRKLIEAVDVSDPEGLGLLILRFFDDFAAEVRRHMEVENRKVFPYVQRLLCDSPGGIDGVFRIVDFSRNHEAIAPKMKELKDIIVRYYPGAGTDMLNSALFDIITCENDLTTHCDIEDELFVPAVKRIEDEVDKRSRTTAADAGHASVQSLTDTTDAEKIEALSDREKEIIVNIAKGLSNKEIADRLCLSVHTVTTHRRNISQKLSIHTPAGLTIFAIVNHLIPPGEIPRPR